MAKVLSFKEYQQHQREGWVNFRDEVKPKCSHRFKQYYDRSDGKTKCSKCKKEVI